jgi:hypothetical protein
MIANCKGETQFAAGISPAAAMPPDCVFSGDIHFTQLPSSTALLTAQHSTTQHSTAWRSPNSVCCWLLRAANVKVIKTGTENGCFFMVQQVKDEVRAHASPGGGAGRECLLHPDKWLTLFACSLTQNSTHERVLISNLPAAAAAAAAQAAWKAYSDCEKSADNANLYGPLKSASEPCKAVQKSGAC